MVWDWGVEVVDVALITGAVLMTVFGRRCADL